MTVLPIAVGGVPAGKLRFVTIVFGIVRSGTPAELGQ